MRSSRFLALVDVDRAARFPSRLALKGRAGSASDAPLAKVSFTQLLVALAGADDAVVLPNRHATPFPRFDTPGPRPDQLAHPAEGFPAPITELGDSVRDQFRCRTGLRLRSLSCFHPESGHMLAGLHRSTPIPTPMMRGGNAKMPLWVSSNRSTGFTSNEPAPAGWRCRTSRAAAPDAQFSRPG